MLYFLLKRLLIGGITLFVVMSLTFFLMRMLPGGPFDLERNLPPLIQKNMETQYHLDQPIGIQYVLYMKNLLQGDLGPSYKYQSRRVNDIVFEAAGYSYGIGVAALLLGVLLGALLGTWSGVTRVTWVDGLCSLLGMSSLSMPSFIAGGFLVLIFSLTFNLLPAATLQTPAHYILPIVTLSLGPFAYAFLLIRQAVQEVKQEGFILIKHAFGLHSSQIVVAHIFRNALISLLSILGPLAAVIVTGSFAVEFIFAIPGLGKHFVTAVANRDYTLVMGITILFSATLLVFNMVSDILYGALDPRLQEENCE